MEKQLNVYISHHTRKRSDVFGDARFGIFPDSASILPKSNQFYPTKFLLGDVVASPAPTTLLVTTNSIIVDPS